MALDILVVGNSSREHALAWKLRQSPKVGKIYIAPGNAGTRLVGENVPIPPLQLEKLAQFAQEHSIDLTIPGSDDPIAAGIVDVFQAHGLRIFGPTKRAAQIEASKAFAKQIMQEAGVPTAEFAVFADYKQALKYLREKGAPIVVKASGLALGKGVFVCTSVGEAELAIKQIMVEKIFGDAGNQVVIEEFLDGPEISIHVFSDGKKYVLFPPSQDHKRAGERDAGPNTGGMGVVAPVPWVSSEMMKLIEDSIVKPMLETLAYRGSPFVGVLYPGLKITSKGPKVLEFNARFGAPECETYMRLLKSDLVDICEACVYGSLGSEKVEWNSGAAVNIMLASQGYPDAYEKGFVIENIEQADAMPDVVVFHSGSQYVDGIIKTNGGRVLAVTATADTVKNALKKAYAAVDVIQYQGKSYRKDIGAKSLTMR